jgi:hypothetical protein
VVGSGRGTAEVGEEGSGGRGVVGGGAVRVEVVVVVVVVLVAEGRRGEGR